MEIEVASEDANNKQSSERDRKGARAIHAHSSQL